MTHWSSLDTYYKANIFDKRLMRSYTCNYNVTGVMQLPRVTDATHGSMPYAPQASVHQPPHRANVVARQLAPFAECSNVPRRRQPTASDGEVWSCSPCAEGTGFTLNFFEDGDDIGMRKCARRRRPVECRRGSTRRSRSRRKRDDDSGTSANRHRGEPQTSDTSAS